MRLERSTTGKTERQNVFDVRATQFAHQQSIETKRNSGAARQSVPQRIEQALIGKRQFAEFSAADTPVILHPLTQNRCVEQLIVTVGDFDAVDDQFEPLCNRAAMLFDHAS